MTTTPRNLIEDALSEVIKRTAEATADAMHRKNVDKEVDRRVRERLASQEMSISDVCALFGCSRAWIFKMRRERGFPVGKTYPGGMVRFLRSEVETWRWAQPGADVRK